VLGRCGSDEFAPDGTSNYNTRSQQTSHPQETTMLASDNARPNRLQAHPNPFTCTTRHRGGMYSSNTVVSLDDPAARDPHVAGAKAANLAAARAAGLPALPGVVLTTDWTFDDRAAALNAWRFLSSGSTDPVIVRSSSTGEDGGDSSMAGVFESVVGVAGEAEFLDAVDVVIGSAAAAKDCGLVDAEMAVLVQPMVDARFGGVLFGADPTSGRTDRLLIASVAGNPSALVSGEVSGWTALLDRRGRVREERSGEAVDRPSAAALKQLARLSRAVAGVYDGPQDIEWAVDDGGRVHLLQARPITTLAPKTGLVYGPGPVAESFPEALAPLEQDMWLEPMRDGIREALRLTATLPTRTLDDRPLLIAVDGMAAVDLVALGVDPPAGGLIRRFDPRPPARRLRAAWRVGRLRSAFTALATDLVQRVDTDLVAVPELGTLTNHELLAVILNGRQELASLHGHEAIAGLLIPDASGASVTGASLALSAVAQGQAEGVTFAEMAQRNPVVLALVPPRVGPHDDDAVPAIAPGPVAAPTTGAAPDAAAIAREALRLRVRWMQELTGRAAWELACRLTDVGVLPAPQSARLLTIDELADATGHRVVPADLLDRVEPDGRPLPAHFRLDDAGRPWAVSTPRRRRRGRATSEIVAVSNGVGTGPVAHAGDDIAPGSILVVAHLDPRLAPLIPRLGGLVAETGNTLSHLAILAREYGVPAVVGATGATGRYGHGDTITVDGDNGTVMAATNADHQSVERDELISHLTGAAS
jgi:phosphohistidine swiveling domain-containing protein